VEHVYSSRTTFGIQGRRERKRERYSINNIVKHNSCGGRGYNEKWEGGRKGVKESNGRGSNVSQQRYIEKQLFN
jgi:hypothetical protein